MATRTFTGTGTNDNFTDTAHWDGGVSLPSAGDNLIIAGAGFTCLLTGDDANTYGTLVINSGVGFDIQTYNFNCGAITLTAGGTVLGPYGCTNTNNTTTVSAINAPAPPVIGARVTGTGTGTGFTVRTITGSAGNYTITISTASTSAISSISWTSVHTFLKIGASAGTGLICGGITHNADSWIVLGTTNTSKITVNGNYSQSTNTPPLRISGTNSTTSNPLGAIVFGATANYTATSMSNIDGTAWYDITVNSGVTLSMQANSYFSTQNNEAGLNITVNGTLAIGGNSCGMGSTGGTITFGASSDITGSGIFLLKCNNACTFVINRSSAFSFTGTLTHTGNSGVNRSIIPGDWSNTSFICQMTGPSGFVTWNLKGVTTCKAFTCQYSSTGNYTNVIKDNGNTLTVIGAIDLNKQVAAGTALGKNSWTNGGGTIVLTGTAGTDNINFENLTLCNISVQSANTKNFMNDFSCASFGGTGGTVQWNTYSAVTGNSFAGNNPVTITKTAHGLRSNNQITISNSSNTAALANGVYTITVVNANSFTIPFNGNNAGGTCDYIPVLLKKIMATNKGTWSGDTLPANTSMGSLKKLNAKGTTNPGGTIGVVFRDKVSVEVES